MALGISEMKLTFLVPETAGEQFSEVLDLKWPLQKNKNDHIF